MYDDDPGYIGSEHQSWENPRCRTCRTNEGVECVGYRSQLIAIDDSVDIEMYYCKNCGMEWEQ